MPVLSREKLLTLPNVLTMLRVGSIPFLVLLLYLPGRGWAWLAALIFAVAGLTDLLDGWLARRQKQETVLGTYLDPMADKLLIASLLVMLVGLGRTPAWAAILIIGREIAVTGMRALATSQGFNVPSDMGGKAKTALQMLAVVLLVLHYKMGAFDPHQWGLWLLYAACLITMWSGFSYFWRFVRKLSAGGDAA